tara:strand:- start:379 stop:1128 length:750 start_codon:yes stop_codon:yes gene_type:complete
MGRTPFKMKGHALPGIRQAEDSPLKNYKKGYYGEGDSPMQKDGWEGTGKDESDSTWPAEPPPGDDMTSPVQNTPTSSRRGPMRHGPGGNMASLTGMPSSGIGPGANSSNLTGAVSNLLGNTNFGATNTNPAPPPGVGGGSPLAGPLQNLTQAGTGGTTPTPGAGMGGSGLINPFASMMGGGPSAGSLGGGAMASTQPSPDMVPGMGGGGSPVTNNSPQGQAMMQQMMKRRSGRNRFGSRRGRPRPGTMA